MGGAMILWNVGTLISEYLAVRRAKREAALAKVRHEQRVVTFRRKKAKLARLEAEHKAMRDLGHIHLIIRSYKYEDLCGAIAVCKEELKDLQHDLLEKV